MIRKSNGRYEKWKGQLYKGCEAEIKTWFNLNKDELLFGLLDENVKYIWF